MISPRGSSQSTDCTPTEARARRDQAQAFIDVAEMVVSALAVLRAIAATDTSSADSIWDATAEATTIIRRPLCSRPSTSGASAGVVKRVGEHGGALVLGQAAPHPVGLAHDQ